MTAEAIARLFDRVRALVRIGRAKLSKDDGPAQTLQVRLSSREVLDDLPRLAEYGFHSRPPADADAVVLFLAGSASDGVVIATGHQTYRLRNLGEGEVALADNSGNVVHLKPAGIEITTGGDLTINATAVRITGQVYANGHRIDETHKHAGVTPGGSLTGIVSP